MQPDMPSFFNALQRFAKICVMAAAFTTTAASAKTELPISPQEIEQVAKQVMDTYQMPGMALAIVNKDQVLYQQTFGVKESQQPGQVSASTLFKIASVSKQFTTAALALLVDEGKIDWDDPVIDYLPEFRVADAWVTRHFTIRDLLIHKSGLNLGAGDLMFWPGPNDFTREDVIRGLQYLPMEKGFRSDYGYDNLLYVIAGEVVASAAGMPYEQFVEQRLMRPLGMQSCYAGIVPEAARKQLAQPHAIVDDLPRVVRRDHADKITTSAAAGGIRCSVGALTQWLQMHLNNGQFKDTKGDVQTLIEPSTHAELWQPQTIMPVSWVSKNWDETNFNLYGLGWRLNDFHGELRVHHTGSLHGMYSYVSLFPEQDVGFVVLMNRAHSDARAAMMYSLIKPYVGETDIDWVARFKQRREQLVAKDNATFEPPVMADVSAEQAAEYLGDYRDPWFGEAYVTYKDGRMQWRSERSQRLIGELKHVKNNTFAVRWDDRTLWADAYVKFTTNMSGDVTGMQMAPIHPDTDFSFDFEDLNFTRLQR